MIISINGNPVTGIDVARYQGPPNASLIASGTDGTRMRPPWLNLMGIKCWDAKYGLDTQFRRNRDFAAKLGVRWRFLYIYLRNVPEYGDISDQMAGFLQEIGSLNRGECVMLDWEDHGVTRADIDEAERILNVMCFERWCMYVNDMTPDMVNWMVENRDGAPIGESVPVVHPSWGAEGWQDARHWNAVVWQVHVANVSEHPDFSLLYPQASAIDVDWVRDPWTCDLLCDLL